MAWFATHITPIVGLIIGVLVLVFVGYINWAGNTKERSVQWITERIYKNSLGSSALANGLFMTITSILLAFGGILVVYSFLFF